MAPRGESKQVRELNNSKKYLLHQQERFSDFLDKYDDTQLDVLKLKLKKAEGWINEFRIVYDSLNPVITDLEVDALMSDMDEFEDRMDEMICAARRLLPQINTSNNSSKVYSETRIEPQIKLPPLGLPHFSGNYEEWTEFNDSFGGIVNNNNNLTPAQKLQYLKSAVQGEAAKAIQSIKISDANYDLAWSLLRKRFEMKNLILKGHIRAIMDIPKLIKESVGQLRIISDTVTKNTRGLESLGINLENWDPLLIYIVCEKLDPVTNREWESTQSTDVLPTWIEFENFLNKRCAILEALKTTSTKENNYSTTIKKHKNSTNLTVFTRNCQICNEDHNVKNCPTWKSLNLEARRDQVKKYKLCYRCFSAWNFKHRCQRSACNKCNGSHHTLLHNDDLVNLDNNINSTSSTDNKNKVSYNTLLHDEDLVIPNTNVIASSIADKKRLIVSTAVKSSASVLLSTVQIFVRNVDGHFMKCRALLDNGAQQNFITERLCKRLRLKKRGVSSIVCGISGEVVHIPYQLDVHIQATFGEYQDDINCLVLEQITDRIPARSFSKQKIPNPNYVRLADPDYNVSTNIDMLLGAKLFWDILEDKTIHIKGGPMLKQTKLGWIWAGVEIPESPPTKLTANLAINDQLQKFWHVEQVIESDPFSSEQKACEQHFIMNTTRNDSGRFVVKIPLKVDPELLGTLYKQAERRLLSLERRFLRDESYKILYCEFMKEYENLDHMQRTNDYIENRYFMPHYGVLKESTTTKLRTVFDSSAKTSSGYSFNDIQLVGPVVQNDLFSIVVNFRLPKYAVTADITKMYRQVLVIPEQRKLQCILWRNQITNIIEIYELNTITYGTASAPYLATRCLKQIADNINDTDPVIAASIRDCMYVDDYLDGANSIKETNNRVLKIKDILLDYGFPLRKWLSNKPQVLNGIPENERAKGFLEIGDTNKILGLIWIYGSDELKYRIDIVEDMHVMTKRGLLSVVSRIFDPLGLLAPSIIIAKIMLQRLWQEKLDWDDPLPNLLREDWSDYITHLPFINEICISRHVLMNRYNSVDLIGFADASELAFGACIYFRSLDKYENCTVNLVCAKSRVAPLRPETIPRLELCAAALLARLTKKVITNSKIKLNRCILFSDSTIALSWIKTEPYLLKQFVANRVALIQELGANYQWRHVKSCENPADLVSRGILPDKLHNLRLWWNGPSWLTDSEENWPKQFNQPEMDLPEIRASKRLINVVAQEITSNQDVLHEISNLRKILQTGVLALKWLHNSKNDKKFTEITVSNLDYVLKKLILVDQSNCFKIELRDLKNGVALSKNSKLFKLNPFIDDCNILRVGGRLERANLDYDEKHQIILLGDSILSKRIVEHTHRKLLHCGPQQLAFSLREKYWILRSRILIKNVVGKCVTCFKANPTSITPITGILPSERVLPSPPFYNTGADYCGPFLLRDRKTRGYKITKAYICVFICFSTKAVHIELVSDLSTETFIAALRRFVGRRGKPKCMFTDNGTNFVGSNNELRTFLAKHHNEVQRQMCNEGVEWKFIPPRSPNMGGLWEAAVKSLKRSLKRVIGETALSYEEFITILVQVESVMNSRPLSPMSDDIQDLVPLTPGHFIIGRPLTSLVDENLVDVKINRLTRYQLLQNIVQHFWKRWNKEYLHTFQQSIKGDKRNLGIRLNSLVIIKEDNLPPCRWKMARITELCPGVDGVVRVVKLKTSCGELKRSVRNLCVLPIDD